jgi:hypothetical protein
VQTSSLLHPAGGSHSQSCERLQIKVSPFETSRDGTTIAGYLTTLRHNDFLRSISPRYDHSFGFSPRITIFCISTSSNL